MQANGRNTGLSADTAQALAGRSLRAERRNGVDSPETVGTPRAETAQLGSSRYGYTFRRALGLADLLGLAVAIGATDTVLSLAGRGGLELGPLIILLAFVPVWLFLALAVGLYHVPERTVDHTFADELPPVFLVTTVWVWLYVVVCAIALAGETPLLGPGVLWVATMLAVVISRAFARRLARNRSWYRRAVALIGDREGTDRVLSRVRRHPEWGLEVTSRLLLEGDSAELEWLNGHASHPPDTVNPNGDLGLPGRIVSIVGTLGVDRVILTGASVSLSERTALARLLTEAGYCVDYVYGEPEALYAAAVLHQLEGLPVLSVQPTRLSRGSAIVKRSMDLALSIAGLILLSPLFALVAVLIKLESRGPVFFRQLRAGRNGTAFKALKFRTMVDGADSMRDDLREQSIHGNGDGMLKLQDDPRITRLGAKLRRWSIDELPQLWNVLRGDMSLVGPRPLPLDEAPLVKGHFRVRGEVRPGLTGTWQTYGRSDIPFEDMVKLDYTYVAGWSLREDLRLLLRTVAVVAHGRGTY